MTYSIPVRVQRKRTKGYSSPPNTVYVGRPTRWGNPFPTSTKTIESKRAAVRLFQRWLNGAEIVMDKSPPSYSDIKAALRNKNLSCWCRPGEPCHADVLLEIANA